MLFTETLKYLRTKNGWIQKDVAKRLEVDRTTYNKYETGKTEPDQKTLCKIAELYNVSLDYLLGQKNASDSFISDDEQALLTLYAAANSQAKLTAKAALKLGQSLPKNIISDDTDYSLNIDTMPKAQLNDFGFVEIKVFDQPAAAGLGNYLDEPEYHKEQYPPTVIPEGTDFGILISGDSMEPYIHNGSTVFVKSQISIDSGKIGVFILNGEAFCKKLVIEYSESGERIVKLISLNSKYADITIKDTDACRTIGLVLSCC